MKPILKNSIAILIGIVLGGTMNMAFITVSSSIIPPPEGADVTTMEGLKSSMHLFKPKNFIFPFLAHAVGTLFGSFLAAKIASSHKIKFAFGVGVFFLLGGIINIVLLPSPVWFSILDSTAAYLPMAYFGGKLATT